MAKLKRSTRGRKSIGQKPREVFSIRMDPALRKRVERSARERSGGNISSEVDQLLKEALAAKEKYPNAKIRALLYLIARAAEEIGLWEHDLWSFKAFKAAINDLLDTNLTPKAQPVDSPSAIAVKEIFAPDADEEWLEQKGWNTFGLWISAFLWRSMLHADTLIEGLRNDSPSWLYAMEQARQDFELPPGSKERDVIDNYLFLFSHSVAYAQARNRITAEQTIGIAEAIKIKQRGADDPELDEIFRLSKEFLAATGKIKGKGEKQEGLDRKEGRDLFRHHRNQRH